MSNRVRIEISMTQVDNGYAVTFRHFVGYSTKAQRETVHESMDGALNAIRAAMTNTENALLLPSSTKEVED